MILRILKIAVVCCLFLPSTCPALAAAYWLEINGNGKPNQPVTLQLCYGSMNEKGIRQRDTGKELRLTGDFKLWLSDPQGIKTPLILTLQKDCWQATFTPRTKGIYRITGLNDQHPVVDRSASGGESIRPVDYICAAYVVDGQNIGTDDPLQALDIAVTRHEDRVQIQAFQQGKPALSGSKLRVFNPDNWEKELILDEEGQTRLYLTTAGLYIIRLDWTVSGAGVYQGIRYSSTRHRCNYYLQINH